MCGLIIGLKCKLTLTATKQLRRLPPDLVARCFIHDLPNELGISWLVLCWLGAG